MIPYCEWGKNSNCFRGIHKEFKTLPHAIENSYFQQRSILKLTRKCIKRYIHILHGAIHMHNLHRPVPNIP